VEDNLISKKDLLEITGISYGALYRWKRKQLIPEDWFIRKSTFTGQETFFPKNKILARIEKIKGMKENLSLNDLASVFSPSPTGVALTAKDLAARNIVNKSTLNFFLELSGKTEGSFSFREILGAYVLDQGLQSGSISRDEGKLLLDTLEEHYPAFEGRNCELLLVRKLGITTGLMAGLPNQILFEKNARLAARFELASSVEELKLKIA
jgi:hypothetical protein